MSWHEDDAGTAERAENEHLRNEAHWIVVTVRDHRLRYCRGCGIDLTRFNRAGEKALCKGCDAPPPIEDV